MKRGKTSKFSTQLRLENTADHVRNIPQIHMLDQREIIQKKNSGLLVYDRSLLQAPCASASI